MINDLDDIDLACLIIATSAFLVSKNAGIEEVPDDIIERLIDLSDYEMVIRSESPLH